jgi:hypothetical protein
MFSHWLDAHLAELLMKRKQFHNISLWLDAHLVEILTKRNN